MAFTSVTDGLTLSIPTSGTRNWSDEVFTNTWKKISGHDHTGSGNGNQITSAAIQSDNVNDTHIRLSNDAFMRGRNQAGAGDISILKVDSDDQVQIGPATQVYQQQAADIAVPSSTAAQDIDCNNGNFQHLDLSSADIALTANLTNIKEGAMYSVLITHGGTAVSITWNVAGSAANVLWPNADQAVLSGDLFSSPTGKVDRVWFYSDGTKIYGHWEVDYQ